MFVYNSVFTGFLWTINRPMLVTSRQESMYRIYQLTKYDVFNSSIGLDEVSMTLFVNSVPVM